MTGSENQAERASRIALKKIFKCLDSGSSFVLEAGAGAGKTYSLIQALNFLTGKHSATLQRRGQKIACITYTNVAKDEINSRTDQNPHIFCETNHAFCWSLISRFQKRLRELLKDIPTWEARIEEAGGLRNQEVEYSLGYRSIDDTKVSLHHDDVLPLTIKMMESPKFRGMMTNQYPYILIDEYQDTDADWANAIKHHFLGKPEAPLFGFFGDHWQKIYGNGCGKIDHPALSQIGKKANFRSVYSVVKTLNRMRPELPQFVEDRNKPGSVRVFHTNNWTRGTRRTGSHWAGDLPTDVAHLASQRVQELLVASGWDLAPDETKILMLTHRALATEQGYSSLPGIFQYNDSFTTGDHPYIGYFINVLEPACDAFEQKRYGEMFEALNSKLPLIRKPADKARWADSMNTLQKLRHSGTVGEVIDHLMKTKRPRLPDTILNNENKLTSFDPDSGDTLSNSLKEIQKLRDVSYAEIKSLRSYHVGHSPFETKHGVKGAQFENVLAVVGRGWNRYNFGEMLDLAAKSTIPDARQEMFERNRNLFYVACSRPKQRLALLFTQQLTSGALSTLSEWFGSKNVEALDL